MDRSQCSGSRAGEDQESKEVAEERSRVQVLEGRRVVQEKEVVVTLGQKLDVGELSGTQFFLLQL